MGRSKSKDPRKTYQVCFNSEEMKPFHGKVSNLIELVRTFRDINKDLQSKREELGPNRDFLMDIDYTIVRNIIKSEYARLIPIYGNIETFRHSFGGYMWTPDWDIVDEDGNVYTKLAYVLYKTLTHPNYKGLTDHEGYSRNVIEKILKDWSYAQKNNIESDKYIKKEKILGWLFMIAAVWTSKRIKYVTERDKIRFSKDPHWFYNQRIFKGVLTKEEINYVKLPNENKEIEDLEKQVEILKEEIC